jgi:hypothetical protein
MAYIGVSPSNGVRKKHTYTATASQTSFSGAGDEGITLAYRDSNYVDVYQNGVKLADEDYTATSGTAIVLAQGASADDIVEIIAFDVFSVADTVSKADGGTFDGDVTMAGTLTANGGAVFNEAGADVDFRVESDTIDHALFVQGSDGNVGIGTSSPDADLSLISPVYSSGGTGNGIRFQNQNNNADAIIQSYYSGTTASALLTGSNVYLSTGASFTSFDGTKPSSYVLQNTNGNIEFANASSGNPTSKMLIDSSGNVAIGTSTATGKLTVDGGFLQVQVGGTQAIRVGSTDHIVGGTDNDAVLQSNTGKNMRFLTGGTESMRISSSGRQTYNGSATANGHINAVGEVGSGSKAMSFEHTVGGGEVGTIVTGASSTAYNTSSDYRLKENVVTEWDATTRLKQLKPSRFNFIADADTTVDGFLAHEVQEIVPEAITGTKDAVMVWEDGDELPVGVSVGDNKLDADGNTLPDYQGIDQSKLVPLLVKTIQELEARITALEGA